EGGGFVQLTGEVGTGKTTICRAFLEELPQSVDVALLLSPPESPRDLILAIAAELQLSLPSGDVSTAELVAVLNRRLLETHAAGRRTMVII
ncbi:MAG: ATP-binding protein, partial [Gammaproteobacteria bacterium]|nr:ATP-binding protein [Gammaproteobacteria bacterium]